MNNNINFVEAEIVDLRQAKFRIANNGGCIVAETTDFGEDTLLVYSDQPKFFVDDDEARFGVVHILMDGYVSSFSSGLTLADANAEAYSRLMTELTGN